MQELEKLKIQLEEAVNNPNSTMEELTEISNNIDKQIEKLYLNNKVSRNNKYRKYIDREDKEEIILQIQANLLDTYYNISKLELDMLSENIYDYCCLMVHHIPQQDIVKYILDINAKYYDKLSQEDKDKLTIKANIKVFKGLIKKYSKILESNKQS